MRVPVSGPSGQTAGPCGLGGEDALFKWDLAQTAAIRPRLLTGLSKPVDLGDKAVIDRRNEPAKRCFILSQGGQWSELIAKALSERGIDSLRSDLLNQSNVVTEEMLRHLAGADFVIAFLREKAAPNLAFELGAAVAWRKPTLVFTTNYDQLLDGVHSIHTVRAPLEAGEHEIGPDIDRFVRYAGKAHVTRPESEGRLPRADFAWAREQLTALSEKPPEGRALAFEHLIRRTFEKAGMQVVDIHPQDRVGADFIVWQNDVAYELGGPIIIECKYGPGERTYGTKEIRRSVERMEKYINGSDAELGLLVVGPGQRKAPWRELDTPRVLTFRATELIDAIDRGSLGHEVIQRRQRAATRLGVLIGPD